MSLGTTKRPIRISDELWAAVREKASSEGTTASEVIRAFLIQYTQEES